MAGNSQILIRSTPFDQDSAFGQAKSILAEFVLQTRGHYLLQKLAGGAVVIFLPPNGYLEEETIQRIGTEIAGDVYAFTYETIVDGFIYRHFRDGKQLRHLDFGMMGDERTWNVIEGHPEAWEERVFFSEEEKEDQIGSVADLLPEDVPEIEAIYREKRLRLGSRYPFMGGLGSLLIPQALDWPGLEHKPAILHEETIQPPPQPSFWKRLFGGK